MSDLEPRVSAVESRSEKVLQLLQQAVAALFQQRERIDSLEGRLRAQTVVIGTMLQVAHRRDPEGFETVVALLEMSERDLPRQKEDEPALRELRDILAMLRAVGGTEAR
jgi:hypothetical protein